MTRRILVAWSSGKDSAWLLSQLRADPGIEVAGLLTTFNAAHDAVAMHEVPRSLVMAQAAAADLPVWPVELPWPCSNDVYAARMAAVVQRALAAGITAVAFGDLFLADVRAWREQQLAGSGLEALFPLWCGEDGTAALASAMCAGGLRAVLTCIDTRQLDAARLGQTYDGDFVAALPTGIDPCGERGEFHTFCTAAPCFAHPVEVVTGRPWERDGFVYCPLAAAGLPHPG
ncbi:MAG: ATP-binding protein [Gammaproteobacteria bacterium]|nr:ATP-binding protein [Gammaproteobacteria bacterium]MCP5199583.1 ATP-binding protein [Gammaproteobacteria bacterium]